MSAVTTRLAEARDAQAIAALHRATHAEHLAMAGAYDAEPWDDEITARLIDPDAEAPPFTVLVAELGGRFVGHIVMNSFIHETAGPTFHISDISVRDGNRGYGVGRALVAAAEEEAQAQEMTGMLALIWPQNSVSRAFFTEMGYACKLGEKKRHVIAYKQIGAVHEKGDGKADGPANIDRLVMISLFGFLAFIAVAITLGLLS